LTAENTQYVSSSLSVLRHVEISGAGRGRFKGRANATSAIEAWGTPPVMDYILIENSAYNGKQESVVSYFIEICFIQYSIYQRLKLSHFFRPKNFS